MAAPARPYWTGFLKLSLVTISVRLYTATTERERIHFHQIHEPSGERIKYQLTVPGIGPVERSDIVKGYEYDKGRYVTIESDDLKKLRLETTDTIDISQFVPAGEIDPMHLDQPYYLVPDGSVAEEGFRVIREALRQANKVAIGQVVINGRERVIAIAPCGKGLVGNALRFDDEIRDAGAFFDSIADAEVDDDQLGIMEQIIARKTRDFDASKFVDHYEAAVKELIEEKLQGKLPEKAPERRSAEVINLMDALKRSLAEDETSSARSAKDEKSAKSAPRRAAKKSEPAAPEPVAEKPAAKPKAAAARAQRSFLLPVSGGAAKSGRAAKPQEVKSAKAAPVKSATMQAPAHQADPAAAKRRKKAS